MKVLVPIKRVIDAYVKIRVKSDQSGVETNNVKMSMNPFDEIAVEEAVKLKEKGQVEDIILVSIGAQDSQETLRTGLALGGDRAIHVDHANGRLDPLNIAKILKIIVEQEQPNFIIMGKQAIDDDNNQTGQMLAALLNWPQATFASQVELAADHVQVTREIDGGGETLKLSLPAIITTDLRLNQPRYASLPNIMKAKKKPLEVKTLDDLGISLKKHIEIIKVEAPTARKAGITVNSVTELVEKLHNEAKVI